MGLRASQTTTRDMPPEEARQYVLDALSADPAGRQGPPSIRENIRITAKVHLTVYEPSSL
jgi:hypothetical protein